MRSFQLHVPSVALGLAACAVVFLAMSQAAPYVSPYRIEYGPNPRDMVTLLEGVPYTVPAGTRFVLTAGGTTNGSFSATLSVNGHIEAVAGGFASAMPIVAVPQGVTFDAGSSMLVVGNGVGNARFYGYLSR